MAGRGRRLGAVLSGTDPDTTRERELLEALELLAGTDGTRGRERRAAEAVAAFGARRWPEIDWRVEPVGDSDGPCAQLVASVGDADRVGLLLYSHLDTSLTGDPDVDRAVTGCAAAPSGFRVDPQARTVRGPGLGVARGPAAAALVGFAHAASAFEATPTSSGVRLLLAARGTHRAATWTDSGAAAADQAGVQAYLARHGRPAAALVAKGGPDGVLYDEPGACYLRVRARAGWGAVMSRDRLEPDGGVLAHLGVLVEAVEAAGAALVAAAPRSGQAGAQFGIGAVRSGLTDKPDLAPGIVELYCYLVAPGPLVPGEPAGRLADRLRTALAGTVLREVDLAVVDQVIHAGAGTDPQAPVVRAADRAYREVLARAPRAVSGWTGSTDGVVLRAAGIPTARVGPSHTSALGDGSDVADIDELLACSRVYESIVRETGAISGCLT